MFYKIIFSLSTITLLVSSLFQASALQAVGVQDRSAASSVDFSNWFIENETSVWTPVERLIVEIAISNAMDALADAGLDGEALLGGFRFVRFAGEYANDKKGKIALTYYDGKKIILSDSIFLPENIFYIYHELGHVVDYRSGHILNDHFHELTLQIDGVTALHDWTTAQGFFLRGQAHVHKIEATADAFALWVYVAYAGNPVPEFPHMPENGNPDAIIRVYEEAQTLVLGSEKSALSSHQ
jgi:hypothetical protein